MSYETGGRGDKYGNTYENEYLARLFLRLVNGKLKSICVEPIGEGHDAIEYITTDLDNINEYYQCKGSNGEQQYWRCSDLQKYDTFSRAKQILEQDPNGKYIFVSPLGYEGLDELCNRARTCTTSKDFVEYQLNSKQKKLLSIIFWENGVLIKKMRKNYSGQYFFFLIVILKPHYEESRREKILKRGWKGHLLALEPKRFPC